MQMRSTCSMLRVLHCISNSAPASVGLFPIRLHLLDLSQADQLSAAGGRQAPFAEAWPYRLVKGSQGSLDLRAVITAKERESSLNIPPPSGEQRADINLPLERPCLDSRAVTGACQARTRIPGDCRSALRSVGRAVAGPGWESRAAVGQH